MCNRASFLLSFGCWFLAIPSMASAAYPDWYVAKDTWHATMRASLNSLADSQNAARAPGFEPLTSDVLHGGQPARHVRVSVAGVKRLSLAVRGVPDYRSAHANWADARLIADDGCVTHLSDLTPYRVNQPYGTLRFDASHRGGPIVIGGKQFERGLGTHAPSEVCYLLDGKYRWFEAWIGVDAAAGNRGHVQFSVIEGPDERVEGVRDTLWRMLKGRFAEHQEHQEMDWEREDGIWNRPGDVTQLARRYADGCSRSPELAERASRLAASVRDEAGLQTVRQLYLESRHEGRPKSGVDRANFASVRLAVTDLMETFADRYPHGRDYLTQLDALEKLLDQPLAQADLTDLTDAFESLRREALLGNPLLDFDRLLLIKRRPFQDGQPTDADASFGWDIGLPRSSFDNSSIPQNSFDDQIAVLSPVSPDGKLTRLFQPEGHKFVGDVDLDFDAERLIFSMRDDSGMFQIHEIRVDGTGLRQLSLGDQPDVDSYDGCYLGDGRIVYASSGCFQGVPCNKSHVSVLYRMDADGSHVRQLCFEQDHDYNPAMLPTGRVLYLRWEYSDLPHSNSRMMFSMNPDGTQQTEYYGSGSYWPNSIFGARPIPGSPGKFVGIVAGHHGSHREGELVLFDVGRGRREAEGAVQRIPGHGLEVKPIVRDQLTAGSWPKFAHPYPLSQKYFLVTCKLNSDAPWDLYLVDVFDNLLPVYHVDGYALFEPMPLKKTQRPPAIPDRVDPARNDAVVHLVDIYRGKGLAGVPRGTVKRLRLFTYHFAYQGMGGLLGSVGLDGPWDIKRVLGTVPVEPDGSAHFRIPANTPISLQPLDDQGKALQLMRSWLVGMPGEVVSCVGCHESQSTTPVNVDSTAARRRPSEIEPWHGPPRNFSYKREVQPVIDRYCVGCHGGDTASDLTAPDLRGTELTSDYKSNIPGNAGGAGGRYFSVGYYHLSRYVRRPGIESDIHMLRPMEYHADTTELVQMLQKGHHGVKLNDEAWDRLITWIDLNTPYHGTWTEVGWDPGPQRERRRQLRRLYAGVDEDPESLLDVEVPEVEPLLPEPPVPEPRGEADPAPVVCQGWPLDAEEAARRQRAVGLPVRETVDLGDGVALDLLLIPAGEFVMGDTTSDAENRRGVPDERPPTRVRIERPFLMGTTEITNRQFAQFDPAHDSRFESKNGYQFGVTGFELNRPRQPVVRVRWYQAEAFCRWLSERTGRKFTLPTEAQWEYACRAGTGSAFSFGEADDDFSRCANVADAKLQDFASDPYSVYQPLGQFTRYDDWIPRDKRFDDGGLVTVDVGRYLPNIWGLRDMHGNAAEWTRTAYRPYPYDSQDGRDDPSPDEKRVVRGGSWRDRPSRCRSAFRLGYLPWQSVYNVGFRVVCEVENDRRVADAGR